MNKSFPIDLAQVNRIEPPPPGDLLFVINPNSAAPAVGIVCRKDRDGLTVTDEIFLETGSAANVATEMIKRYGGKKLAAQVELVPDYASGKANYPESTMIFNMLEPNFAKLSERSKFDPDSDWEKSSISHMVNIISCNMPGYRLKIKEGLSKLVRDLEQLQYIEGTRKINREDPTLGHLSACLQSVCYRVFPVRRFTTPVKSKIPPPYTGARLFWDQRHKIRDRRQL